MTPARCDAGIVWIQTVPGPDTTVLKRPSPPKSIFLTPGPVLMSTYIEPAEDFPFELIEGGRDYPWHTGRTEMYFYEYEGEIIWGLTARILHAFAASFDT